MAFVELLEAIAQAILLEPQIWLKHCASLNSPWQNVLFLSCRSAVICLHLFWFDGRWCCVLFHSLRSYSACFLSSFSIQFRYRFRFWFGCCFLLFLVWFYNLIFINFKFSSVALWLTHTISLSIYLLPLTLPFSRLHATQIVPVQWNPTHIL